MMERNEIRIGRVSSVNKKDGTCRVVYKDKDNAVTMELPLFCFTGEYRYPEIDSLVLVAHLSNGSAAGIVMGGFWSDEKRPADRTADWRKELSDDAYMALKDGTLTIKADKIKLITEENEIDADEIQLKGESEPEPDPEEEGSE